MTSPEPKPEHKLWANVTILTAVIGFVGVLIAAIITIVPDLLNQSNNTSLPGGTQQPTEVASGTPVFSADFENSSVDNFAVELGNWAIGSDGTDGKVLESKAPADSVSTIEFGPSDLNNFIIEYRVNSTYILPQQEDHAGCSLEFRNTLETNYVLFMNQSTPQDIAINYVDEGGWNWHYLTGKSISFESDTWYSVKLVSEEEEVKTYLNGTLYLTVSDSRLKKGNFAFTAGDGALCKFDDIRIWSLP